MSLEEYFFDTLDSPLGKLTVIVDNIDRLLNVSFSIRESFSHNYVLNPAKGKCDKLKKQLDEYFALRRKQFKVGFNLSGTPFQKKVWQALLTIPYGQTKSYAQVAEIIGNPRAGRAVGNAVAANPIVIVVPCHRIIKTSGQIGGYGGGVEKKLFLLRLEGGISTDEPYQS